MAGEDFGEIRKARQRIEDTGIKLMRQRLSRFIPQQIRTSDIADKKKISREQQPGDLFAARFITQSPRHVLGRMARRVKRREPHRSQAHLIPIFGDVIGIGRRPIGPAHAGAMDDDAG
jgi:hypothetical protein